MDSDYSVFIIYHATGCLKLRLLPTSEVNSSAHFYATELKCLC